MNSYTIEAKNNQIVFNCNILNEYIIVTPKGGCVEIVKYFMADTEECELYMSAEEAIEHIERILSDWTKKIKETEKIMNQIMVHFAIKQFYDSDYDSEYDSEYYLQ